MRRNKVAPELIEEANTYYETEDKDILNAREQFKKLVQKYDEQIKEEKQKVISDIKKAIMIKNIAKNSKLWYKIEESK